MNRLEIEAWAGAFIEYYAAARPADSDHPLWWAIEKAMFALAEADAESFWEFVLEVIARGPSAKVVGMLAAGPLEGLIVHAGHAFIDRIEGEAQRNLEFRVALGGVWQSDTPDPIWARVERARAPYHSAPHHDVHDDA